MMNQLHLTQFLCPKVCVYRNFNLNICFFRKKVNRNFCINLNFLPVGAICASTKNKRQAQVELRQINNIRLKGLLVKGQVG